MSIKEPNLYTKIHLLERNELKLRKLFMFEMLMAPNNKLFEAFCIGSGII